MAQILLVNKDTGTLNILTRILRTEGYKVVTASSAAIARNLIKDNEFNLMICDTGQGEEQSSIDLITVSYTHLTLPTIYSV